MSVKLEVAEMSNSNQSLDELPLLNMTCDGFSSLSLPVHCPSLTENFLSGLTSALDHDGAHRNSFRSSTTSPTSALFSSSSTNVTSPTTPMAAARDAMFGGGQYNKLGQEFECTTMYSFSKEGFGVDEDPWIGHTDDSLVLPHPTSLATMPSTSSFDFSDHSLYTPRQNTYVRCVGSVGNLALSQPIFNSTSHSDAMAMTDEDLMAWPPPVMTTPPQTIAPSATLQPMMVSSPVAKYEPSTPWTRRIHSSTILSSSPMSIMSPPVLSSQHEIDGLAYDDIDELLRTRGAKRRRSGTDRLHRRGYERKRHFRPSSKPKLASSKSGIDCDVVIAQNEFACSYAGCIDKQTGKQKRFKRQEHKKRHEKTVHEREKHGVHKCWVPGCKTLAFTRTDNLKSHLKNTHGKKSPNQRNRYVATQDKNSEYYNPEWEGDLTVEGLPKRSTS